MFGMSMYLREHYVNWLETIAGNRAVDKGLKTCQKCGYCCALRPCLPTPEELKNIAKFLKLPLKECVENYFVVDDLGRGTEIIFPAKETQKDITGEWVPCDRTYDTGYCIFLDKETKLCKIYPVRPKQARNVECWNESEEDEEKMEKELAEIIATWKNEKISDYTDKYTGKDEY